MKLISSVAISISTFASVSVNSFSPLSSVSSHHTNVGFAIDSNNNNNNNNRVIRNSTPLFNSGHPSATSTEAPTGFIDKELRGAAMKLHTRSQAPTEGEAQEMAAPTEPYITTMDDYLHFLVDSQHVYRVFEEIMTEPALTTVLNPFVDTGLERTGPLETDIQFIVNEYEMVRPEVGEIGAIYAKELRELAAVKDNQGVPQLICHYYNHYFAHTAGGRMIGKQMSSLLLNKKTLEFYKWDGDLKKIKSDVKNSIEVLAASWSREEKDLCVDATQAAFQGGGMLNAYLMGISSPL